MPTNDERREVAARLREVRANLENIPMPRGVNQASFIYLTELARALGNDGNIFNRLADLIEPEERTCKPVVAEDGANEGSRVCSECGRLYWSTPFCAYCGAKAVGE